MLLLANLGIVACNPGPVQTQIMLRILLLLHAASKTDIILWTLADNRFTPMSYATHTLQTRINSPK